MASATSSHLLHVAPSPEWFVCLPGGQPVGPVSTDQLLKGLSSGSVPRSALVARSGDPQWTPVIGIQALARHFGPPPSPAPPPDRAAAIDDEDRAPTRRMRSQPPLGAASRPVRAAPPLPASEGSSPRRPCVVAAPGAPPLPSS